MPADHYYEQANPDLLYRIPVTARAVLEVGWKRAREFKAVNPDCTYIGIELMPEPATKARNVLDHVIEGNINELTLDKLPGNTEKLDCLVFGDVLEHIDPEQFGSTIAIPKRQWRCFDLHPECSTLECY